MIERVVPAPSDVAFDRDSGRARLPDEIGLRDGARRRAARVRRLRRAATRRSCCCRRRRSSTRASGRARSTTSAATTGSSPTTGAATAARTGRSDPPPTSDDRIVDDLEAVMDATGHGRARCSSGCASTASGDRSGSPPTKPGARRGHRRVRGRRPAARAAPAALRGGVGHVRRRAADRPTAGRSSTATTGGATTPDFARFFFTEIRSEPHSTKAIEDAAGWALDGPRSTSCSPRTTRRSISTPTRSRPSAARSRCPMLLVHGVGGHAASRRRAPHRLAELTGAPLVIVEGADHMIPGRHPVLANLLIRQFVESLPEVRA